MGPAAATGAQAQTAEEVATAIAAVIDHPAAEIFTNPHLGGIARKYFDDVGAFEAENRRRG